MKFSPKFQKSDLILIILPVLVYLPAFLTEFGMHNDYRFIPCQFYRMRPFSESEHLFMVGRALQAYLITLQNWCFMHIRDLTFSRMISFILMLVFAFQFDRFLRKRLHLDLFWSRAITLSVLMLPSSEIFILWATQLLPGFLTLVLAMGSYLILDAIPFERIRDWGNKNRILRLIGAALLYICALFIYPMNAVFVFVCTFAVIIFSGMNDWAKTWKIIRRDMFFFGCCMAVYFLINVTLILPTVPLALVVGHELEGSTYDFSVSLDLQSKIKLIFDTFLVALGGVWHTVFFVKGALVQGSILLFGALALLVRWLKEGDRGSFKRNSVHVLLFIGTGISLFVVANSPAFIAKGCFQLIGYRVLFPAGVFILVLLFGILRKCQLLYQNQRVERVIRFAIIGIVVLSSAIAWVNSVDASRNYHRELTTVREQADGIDFKAVKRILVVRVPDGQTLIGRKLPLELGMMITLPALVKPIIYEVARKKGMDGIVPTVDVDDGNIIYFNKDTALIDINEGRIKSKGEDFSFKRKPLALVTTSEPAGQSIEITRERAIFFTFQQTIGAKKLPFWLMDFTASEPHWIQLDFQNGNYAIAMFTFGVYLSNSRQKSWPVDCKLKGSTGGEDWVDLALAPRLMNDVDQNFKVFQVITPRGFKKYRVLILNKGEAKAIPVPAVHMVFGVRD